jgi:cystathionine beta-lyase family protein involved in aluminum resistance
MNNIDVLVNDADKDLKDIFNKYDKLALKNSKKVLEAFHKYNVSESDFAQTTGYGYGDTGRDKIEKIYADIFGAEDALVRNQFISGTHAITSTFFGILRPGDTLLSITGKPYDTLDSIIGFNDNPSSLKAFNINYLQIDLIDNDFDYKKIAEVLQNNQIKMIEIQRSKGYSLRESIGIKKIAKVIEFIRNNDKDVIIMVDNCYTEFVEELSPCEVGADIMVGSLIKNLGGGIATNGAYIVGKSNLIKLCSERLNVPGEAKEVGPSLGANKMFLQGLYMSPSAVASSLKTAIFAAYMLEKMGYKVSPRWNSPRADIVETIYFEKEESLVNFVQGIQAGSAIDANVLPIKSDMPGYDDKIIMASGSFTQGSSIELSCDGPIRAPYVAYLQGGLTYEYGKLGIITALNYLIKK